MNPKSVAVRPAATEPALMPAPTNPSTLPATGPSLDSGSGSDSGFTLSENNPAPGRYFIDLANTQAGERQVDIAIDMAETEVMVKNLRSRGISARSSSR